MVQAPKILAISGSLRKESYNTKILRIAAAAAEAAGAEVTYLDLKKLDLPIYDGDLQRERGLAENMRKAKMLFEEHDGLLIASPEHNSTITAALKNLIDWVSVRASQDEPALHSLRGKVAGIMSASPGVMGGLRGLLHLREILQNVMVMVMPSMQSVSLTYAAFTEDGALAESTQQEKIEAIGAELAKLLVKIGF